MSAGISRASSGAEPRIYFLGSPVEVAQECEVIQLFVADARAVMETLDALAPVLTPQHLAPTSARAMLIRMLTNVYYIGEQTDPPLSSKVGNWLGMLRAEGP